MVPELARAAIVAGRYRLERPLGEGGMGSVWAATHTVTRRRVALKFLKSQNGGDAQARRRFLREARAGSAIDHPNVVRIHDVFDSDDGTPVIVMDLLEGETFAARLERERKLTLADAASVLLPVVSAVGTGHALGVVHRDLKPGNVFLVRGADPAARVKVLDFGIAKLTHVAGLTTDPGVQTGAGMVLGTPYYMAPEQAFGEPDIDHRVDVWTIGVMLYEALSGERPVGGDTLGQVLKRLISGNVARLTTVAPALPGDVTELVDRMLSVPREERPPDLREVAALLRRYTDVTAPEFGAPGSRAGEGPGSADDAADTVAVDPAGPTCQAPSTDRTAPREAATPVVAPVAPVALGASGPATPQRARSRRALVAAGLVVAALGAGGVWLAVSRPETPRPAPAAIGPPGPRAARAPAPVATVPASLPAGPAPAAPAASLPATAPAPSPARPAKLHRPAGPPRPAAPPKAVAPPPRPAAPTSGGLLDEPPF